MHPLQASTTNMSRTRACWVHNIVVIFENIFDVLLNAKHRSLALRSQDKTPESEVQHSSAKTWYASLKLTIANMSQKHVHVCWNKHDVICDFDELQTSLLLLFEYLRRSTLKCVLGRPIAHLWLLGPQQVDANHYRNGCMWNIALLDGLFLNRSIRYLMFQQSRLLNVFLSNYQTNE